MPWRDQKPTLISVLYFYHFCLDMGPNLTRGNMPLFCQSTDPSFLFHPVQRMLMFLELELQIIGNLQNLLLLLVFLQIASLLISTPVDPLNSQNNLGRSCFGFRQIQTEFDNALGRALKCLEDGTLECSEPLLSDGIFNDKETCREKISSSPRKTKSVLGTIFGTMHHDSKSS